MVDGARTRWWPLLVMDAAAHLLGTNTWCFASRRAFYQHKALFDAILTVVADQNEDLYYALASGHHSHLLGSTTADGLTSAISCSHALSLQLTPLPMPWQTMDQLKAYLLADSPSKSKLKYTQVIDFFQQHHLFAHYSMHEVLHLLISKVIVYFACGHFADDLPGRSPKASPKSSPKAKSSAPAAVAKAAPMRCRPTNHKRSHSEMTEMTEVTEHDDRPSDLSMSVSPDIFDALFDFDDNSRSSMTSFCDCLECSNAHFLEDDLQSLLTDCCCSDC